MVALCLVFALAVLCLGIWFALAARPWLALQLVNGGIFEPRSHAALPSVSSKLRAILVCKQLELRCVPATFLWAWNGGGAGNWNAASNWREMPANDAQAEWKYAVNTYPGADPERPDDVIFAGNFPCKGAPTGAYKYNSDCKLTVPVTVHNVSISSGFLAQLSLLKPLTISGSDGSSRMTMASNATIIGSTAKPGEGKIVLDGSSGFNWMTGTLAYVAVDVLRDTSLTTSFMNIGTAMDGLPIPQMAGAAINVWGELAWVGKDVQDYNHVSKIRLYTPGTFTITAAGGTLGAPIAANQPDPKLLKVTNEGTLTLNTPQTTDAPEVDGDYYSDGGWTNFVQGALTVDGQASQVGGSSRFNLSPNTVLWLKQPPAVGASGVLNILNGTITGTGSIGGSLALGDGTPNTNPVIAPMSVMGSNGGSGVILVRGNLQINNGNVQVGITKRASMTASRSTAQPP